MTKLGESNDGEIEYVIMTEDDAVKGLELLRVGFFPHENVCIACGVPSNPAACKELENLCLEAADDGVSLAAKVKATGRLVGVCYNKIQAKAEPGDLGYFEKFRDDKCAEKSSKTLMDFMIEVDAGFDTFGHYKADCSLELMFLATDPDYRRKNIATDLVNHSLRLGQSLKNSNIINKPQICTIICTAIGSYKVCKKLDFDELHFVKWNEIEVDGVTYDKKLGNTAIPGSALMAKRL